MRNGLELIKRYEGCKLKAYKCPAGISTIGYGLTRYPNGQCVKIGDTCTQQQADAWLISEYDSFEGNVRALVKVPVSDNQLGALTCFAYNVGLANLKASTLLKKVNAGNYAGATTEFAKWNKARVNGVLKPLAGLTKRRASEAELFAKV